MGVETSEVTRIPEPMPTELLTIVEAAKRFGTDRHTIRGLIRAHGIEPKPYPHNGLGKGLDAKDLAILAGALGLRPEGASKGEPDAN